jgi:hypothetical protein
MSDIPVEEGDRTEEEAPRPRGRRPSASAVEVDIEREVTKRHLIEAISSVVVVVLYMLFTLLRDRDQVVALDPDGDAHRGAADDDWQ